MPRPLDPAQIWTMPRRWSWPCILVLASDFVNCLSQPLDIGRGDAGHRDASVSGRVDGMLFSESIHLLGCETRVCKHADLESVRRGRLQEARRGSICSLPDW